MAAETTYADWIAVDWGTTHLRAWAMSEAGEARADAQSDDGMGRLAPDGFEPALLALIAPWLGRDPVDIVACGMVGSSEGWLPAPYAAVPCRPLAATPVAPSARDARLRMRILPGVKQTKPADVMRGEETQIAGFLDTHPGFDGVLCLPGSHSKWVEVSAGEIISFRTFLTGELFAALASHTVLRHSVTGSGWDEVAFAEALAEALSKPEALAARLFALRAEALLDGLAAGAARARLSGLLIGVEFASARPYWLGRPVAVVGETRIATTYAAALTAQGLAPEIVEGDAMTRAGLTAARARLRQAAA